MQVGQFASFVGERASCAIADGMGEPQEEQLLETINVTAIPFNDFLND